MDDVIPFGALLGVVCGVGLLAVLSNRLSTRLRVPAPAFFLVGAAVASAVVPALGGLSITAVQRVVTVALLVILFDGGMHIGLSRFRSAAGPIVWLGVAGTVVTAAALAAAARWLFGFDWHLALLLGTTGLRLLVLREPLPVPLSNRLYGLAAAGGIATLNVGIAAFVMRADDALQLPFGDLLYGDLSPIATKTRFGLAFIGMTLGYAVVTALVLLAWILDRPSLLWPSFLVGVGFATGLSLSGHQGVEPNATFLTGLADWLHLVAALMWVGGLVGLALCVWPLAPALRRSAFLGFSRIATVLVAVLVVAGTYLSTSRLPSVSDLWETPYGRTLLVKLATVGAALGWGAVHHFVVRPRLERDDAPRGLRRSLIGESSVALLVLLVAAVLVNAQPPPVEPAGSSRVASTLPP